MMFCLVTDLHSAHKTMISLVNTLPITRERIFLWAIIQLTSSLKNQGFNPADGFRLDLAKDNFELFGEIDGLFSR